ARLPPVGSCQCVWPGTSCMGALLRYAGSAANVVHPSPPGQGGSKRFDLSLRMLLLLGGGRLAAAAFEFCSVGCSHLGRQPVLGEFAFELLAGFGILVAVIDLVAADAPADPGFRHALRVADGDALVLEGEIARRRRPGVKMLVHPHVGR